MGQHPSDLQRGPGGIVDEPQPRHACRAFPEDTSCLAIIAPEDIWCTACRTRRQAAIAAGIPESGFLPVGIVIEDLDAPRLMCLCGGEATAPNHRQTLTHIIWSWRVGPQSS